MLNHKSTKEEKIDWLIKHQSMWEGLKLPEEYYKIINIAELMVEEGLYSKKTYYLDITHSVNNLIKDARTERRRRKYEQQKI